MKPHAIIVDIDGTLANNDHRRHFVEGPGKKDWKSFFAAQHLDLPKVHVGTAVELLCVHFRYAPILLTGRGVEHHAVTREWIDYHFPFLRCTPIRCRPEGDYQPDVGWKREAYEKEIAPYYDVKLCVDDRDSVVALWRSLGLECWQVAAGDF